MTPRLLLLLLLLLLLGSSQVMAGKNVKAGPKVAVTQPMVVSAMLGQTASLECHVSRPLHQRFRTTFNLAWYQQKDPSQVPTLLIYQSTTLRPNVPTRFSGSAAPNALNFTLTISGVQDEDAAIYYCQSSHEINGRDVVFSFGGGTRLDVGTKSRPSLMVLPPSGWELQGGVATLLCLASGGFPRDWSLSWSLEGPSCCWEEARGPALLQADAHYSWSSTLRVPAVVWEQVKAVTCQASRGLQTPVSHTLRVRDCKQP